MKNETDTIELLLAVALEVAEALLVLTVALVALVLTVARWRPAPAPPAAPAPAPAVHPLALVAAELETLPVTTLRPMVGISSKRLPKRQLVALAVACC